MPIEIGSTVADLKGRHVGVVLSFSQYYDDQVFVRSWSPSFKQYIHFFKRTDLLQEVDDPGLLNFLNPDDKVANESVRLINIDIALMTRDKKLFEDSMQAER